MTTHATTLSAPEPTDRQKVLYGIAFSLAHMGLNGHIAPEDVLDIGDLISRIRGIDRECRPRPNAAPLPDWSL